MKKEAIVPGKLIELGYYYELPIQDPEMQHKFKIVLMHYPLLTWYQSHFGSWAIHGHCHGTIDNTGKARLDAGVDCHDYSPISYQEVKTIFTKTIFTQKLLHKKYSKSG